MLLASSTCESLSGLAFTWRGGLYIATEIICAFYCTHNLYMSKFLMYTCLDFLLYFLNFIKIYVKYMG